jgi:serine/threonine protein kinase
VADEGFTERVDRLYEQVRELPPEERAAFLDQYCIGPEERREIESMLAADLPDTLHEAFAPFRQRLAVLHPRERLDHYEIVQLLGRGGMGAVYQAMDMDLGRPVAIKFLLDRDPRKFEHETRAIAALQHPNICVLYDRRMRGTAGYLVMEFLEGRTLRERLRAGALSLCDTLGIAVQLASALDYSHRKGVVHRDLKPENIMLTPTGVKLMDFGIAKLLDVTSTLVMPGVPFGTPAYRSPEQNRGEPTDVPSDIYSFGLVLREMVTGISPADGFRPLPSGVPMALERIILRCIKERPDERFASMRDVRFEVQAIEIRPARPQTGPLDVLTARALAQYRSDNPQAQIEAIHILARRAPTHPDAIEAMVDALADPDLKVRHEAAIVISNMKRSPVEAVTNLVYLLQTRSGSEKTDAMLPTLAAWTLGSIGPHANAAVPDLLECLHSRYTSVAEESAIALVSIGVGDNAELHEVIGDLVGRSNWPATAVLLKTGAGATQYMPALIDAFRRSVKENKYDSVIAQSYIVEILRNIGPQGCSALEQFLATAKPGEQAAITLAWLELDPGARDSIRSLLRGARAMSMLEDYLKTRPDAYLVLPRSLFRENDWIPRAVLPPTRKLCGLSEGCPIRSAVAVLMLDPERSDMAWAGFMRALNSMDACLAAYAAVALRRLDQALVREAVPEIVNILGRWNESSIPAICRAVDNPDPLAALSTSLGTSGDRTTLEALELLLKTELPDHISRALRDVVAAMEARL